MSKRHQSSRRRSYGRRQHELHERFDRQALSVMAERAEEPASGPEHAGHFDLGRAPHLPASHVRASLSFAVAD